MFAGARLYGVIGLAFAVLAFTGWALRVDHLRGAWKAKHEALSDVSGEILVSIRKASGNPKLKLADGANQVDEIGRNRAAWKGTAELQSSRIDELARETARLKALGAEARVRAEAAIARRESAIQRLSREILTPGERGDCARQLFDAEAALDLVYREGL